MPVKNNAFKFPVKGYEIFVKNKRKIHRQTQPAVNNKAILI
jgi:hypothetical protein